MRERILENIKDIRIGNDQKTVYYEDSVYLVI